jgi:AbrB family looped-hinge helix DNA binding protein
MRKLKAGRVPESALNANGRITIPQAIRKHLELLPGDPVRFSVRPDGAVVLQRRGGGHLNPPPHPGNLTGGAPPIERCKAQFDTIAD